jgi:hypothetical protein
MSNRTHPPALAHGELHELFPDVFFLTGTMRMPGPVPIRFSRNMTVVRDGERLTLLNSVRLDDEGLDALDALGRVTDVVRLAGYHGVDDPFYKERYGAQVWTVSGQRYASGFDQRGTSYLTPDVEMTPSTELPMADATLHVIAGNPPEGLVLLDRAGGVLIAGDALQNWQSPDEYFSWPSKVMMRKMGFIRPHNIGPAWLKQSKPPVEDLQALLDIEFEHVLPAHGAPVRGRARDSYRPGIEALA